MDATPFPFVPGLPRRARGPAILPRLAALARVLRDRAGGPRPRPRRPRDGAIRPPGFVPELRDYPWRRQR